MGRKHLWTVRETSQRNGLDPEAHPVVDGMANGHPIDSLVELLAGADLSGGHARTRPGKLG
jgi:hypothetical protein